MLTDRVRRLGARSATQDAAPSGTFKSPQTKPRPAREAVFRNASVTLEDGIRIIVVIKDLSTDGARIEYFARTTLPGEVLLSEPMSNLRRRARVIWQGDGVAGLSFSD